MDQETNNMNNNDSNIASSNEIPNNTVDSNFSNSNSTVGDNSSFQNVSEFGSVSTEQNVMFSQQDSSNLNINSNSVNQSVMENTNTNLNSKAKYIKIAIFAIVGIVLIAGVFFTVNHFSSNGSQKENKKSSNTSEKINKEETNDVPEKASDGYYLAYEDEIIKIEYGDFEQPEEYQFKFPIRYTNKTENTLMLDSDFIVFNNVSSRVLTDFFDKSIKPKETLEGTAALYLATSLAQRYSNEINEVIVPYYFIDSDHYDYDPEDTGNLSSTVYKLLKRQIVKFTWDNDIEYEQRNLGDLVYSDETVDIYHYKDFTHDKSSLANFDDALYIENKTDTIIEISTHHNGKGIYNNCVINDVVCSYRYVDIVSFYLYPHTYRLMKTGYTIDKNEAGSEKVLNDLKAGKMKVTLDMGYYKHKLENNSFTYMKRDSENCKDFKVTVTDYDF